MDIRKVVFTALFIFSFFSFVFSQNSKRGDVLIQAGLGVLPTYFQDASITKIPPIQLTVNHKIHDILSLGVFAGYSSYKSNAVEMYDGSVRQITTQTLLGGARIAAHSNNFDNWNIYGGFQVGYSKPTVDTDITMIYESGTSQSKSKAEAAFIYSGFVGVAGFFTEKIGFFGELGYGVSLINIGVAVKL